MYVWAFPEGDLTVGKLATQRVLWSAWKPVPNLGPETQRPNGSENALKADKTRGENDRQAPETNSTASTMSSVSARIRAEVPGRAARNVMGDILGGISSRADLDVHAPNRFERTPSLGGFVPHFFTQPTCQGAYT